MKKKFSILIFDNKKIDSKEYIENEELFLNIPIINNLSIA
jgi:hypothetical protein